jgi:hypothetical protein
MRAMSNHIGYRVRREAEGENTCMRKIVINTSHGNGRYG